MGQDFSVINDLQIAGNHLSSVVKEARSVHARAHLLAAFCQESHKKVVQLLNKAPASPLKALPDVGSSEEGAPAPTQQHSAAGMWLAMMAMMENTQAIQNYDSGGLIKLALALDTQTLNYSNAWYEVMADPKNEIIIGGQFIAGSDYAKLQWLLKTGADSGTIGVANTVYSMHSTEANNANTFYSGLNNGVNQNSSTVVQTITLNTTNMQTLQQTLVTIANAI